MTNAAYYLSFTFAVGARSSASADGSDFKLANTLSLFVVLVSKVFGGWLSDHVGRRKLMLILTFVAMLVLLPAMWLMMHGLPWQFFIGQCLLAVPLGMALGLQGAMLVEIFPLRTRVTSLSFAYSMTLAVAGGTAPLVSTWLVAYTGQPLAPAWYIMIYGVIALAVIWPMQETNTRTLGELG
jgi:MFS transporter, MHS family, proline/betaine transporter